MKKAATREEWLERMTTALRPKFHEAGYTIPLEVRTTCGWPSSGGVARKKRTVGECWPASSSEAERWEIFVSPVLSDPIKVGGTLVHELAHAAVESQHPDKHVGHGAAFKAAMGPLGMTGKATATTEGAELKRELEANVNKIGPYPHAAMKLNLRAKVQGTRLLKASCPECGYVVRVTAKWVEVGLPVCPTCELAFEVAGGQEGA